MLSSGRACVTVSHGPGRSKQGNRLSRSFERSAGGGEAAWPRRPRSEGSRRFTQRDLAILATRRLADPAVEQISPPGRRPGSGRSDRAGPPSVSRTSPCEPDPDHISDLAALDHEEGCDDHPEAGEPGRAAAHEPAPHGRAEQEHADRGSSACADDLWPAAVHQERGIVKEHERHDEVGDNAYRSLPCRRPFGSAGSIFPPKREACSPPPAVILGRGRKGSGMRADYVIVGAGSAGCALAYRLAEAGRSVIVVEAGGSDAGPFIQMPGALSFPMNMPRYDWGLRTEPEPHLGGRRLVVPRGRVIGGSSSINGMVWVRGHARDFDHWAQAGARGWAWRDVLPYYRRLEAWDGKGQGGDADWRGTDGPVRVSRGPRANPLFDIFVQAAAEAGYGITGDYNGHRQEGIGPADQTVHGGRRWSAARAYLGPAIRRFNCRLVRGEVARVRFEGRRALGVELAGGDVLSARREVILSASAINSPKLLMLSGVGPAAALADLGIEVVADRPGVGQNLQDHLEVYVQIASRQPVTLYRYWNLAGKAYVGLRWLLSRTGPGASNQIETLGFLRSRAGVDYPDIQFHFMPIAMRYDGQIPPQGHGFQAHVGPMRSPSRGREGERI